MSWRYPRFRTWQYLATGVASGINLYDDQLRDRSDRADKWQGGILFDDSVRSMLRARSRAGRRNADALSDWFWHPPELYPLIVDGLFVPLALDDWNVEVSWQMTLLYLQSVSLASVTLRAIRYPVGRSRPDDLEACEAASGDCRLQSLSFPSGHAQMTAAGAGVGCAHHLALPLYGGGWPDIAACGVLSAAAATNGVLRVAADRHWATDVVSGWLLGGAIGFGLPWLLHYGQRGRPSHAKTGALPSEFVILPLAGETRLGLTIVAWL